MKLTVFLLAITSANLGFAKEIETKEFDSSGLSEIQVENLSGKVTITSSDNSKSNSKTIVTATKNKFSSNCKLTIEKPESKLLVKVQYFGFMNISDCDVDFTINVPKTVNVNVINNSGDIRVTGIQGELEYKVGSGDVTADGEIKNIKGISGSGDITLKGISGGGELKTGSGEINLTFTNNKMSGEIDIISGSGGVTALFPKGTLIKTNFKAGIGELTNELGDSPNAKFKLSMKTGSGYLNVKAY
ncbi:MAG: DUF4097 family beta strand repeat protein [Oligoflexales bacterium]|nr:DUF4097 family beta strand repeat protein [Oligoflexales bacterium]